MTQTSYPYVAQDVTDIEYGRLFREMAGGDGVVGSHGDTSLEVYGDSSGMNVKVRSGSAVLRGYMFYSTDNPATVAVSAASAGNRVDRVVLELNLSAPLIPDRITLKVLAGTSGSSTPPALTQTDTGIYQISLATVNVDASVSSIAAGKVSSTRTWLDQSVGQWASNALRPATPDKYKLGFNESIGGYEYWNGTAWVALSAVDLTSASVTGILPLTKGGTGASTLVGAQQALDIWVQTTQPAYAANRVWIKVP